MNNNLDFGRCTAKGDGWSCKNGVGIKKYMLCCTHNKQRLSDTVFKPIKYRNKYEKKVKGSICSVTFEDGWKCRLGVFQGNDVCKTHWYQKWNGAAH